MAACASGQASAGIPRSGDAASGGGSAAVTPHSTPRAGLPLQGKVIGIDPGHNGRNYADPSYLNHQIWNGREREACDTTGTQTNSGYTEPRFTWRVAMFLRRDLRRKGAAIAITRHNNHGVGPCVNTRARILNRAHSVVAIDIHGDGGPPGGRGFAVLEPVADGRNNHIIRASNAFGREVRRSMLAHTSMPVSTYDGLHGLTHRNDLAGLNLATEPKVLIECGNMRNATDARLMTSRHFQRQVAKALTNAIVYFVTHH
jgi:N-acetylmuramoyl-L-alanine amidase